MIPCVFSGWFEFLSLGLVLFFDLLFWGLGLLSFAFNKDFLLNLHLSPPVFPGSSTFDTGLEPSSLCAYFWFGGVY